MLHCALVQLDHRGLIVKVYDQDVVEPHNVGRSRFAWGDAGMNKAQALIAEVNRAYNLVWVAAPGPYVPDMNTCHKMSNIVITCVDTGELRNAVQKVFKAGSAKQSLRAIQAEHEGLLDTHYWLDLGNEKDFGQVVLGGEGLPTCVDVFGKYPKDKKGAPTCSMATSLKHQDLFINQYVATVALDMLWNLFRRGTLKRPQVYVNINQDRYAVRATKLKSHEKRRLHRVGRCPRSRRSGVQCCVRTIVQES